MHLDQKLWNLFIQNLSESYRSAMLLQSSYFRMKRLMPLTLDKFLNLTDEKMDMIDAFRLRFCDLQDSLGNKVFRSVLTLEEENVGSGLDVLNKMEKRGIIDSFDSFKVIRNIRNCFSHDYPDSDEAKIELLNSAFEITPVLIRVLNNVIAYVNTHFKHSQFNFKSLEI
jgi:hypothetical protein